MKIITTIALYCFMFPLLINAQSSIGLTDTYIKFQNKSYTIEKILAEISHQSNIIFSYEPKEIPLQAQIRYGVP